MATATFGCPGDGLSHPWSVLAANVVAPGDEGHHVGLRGFANGQGAARALPGRLDAGGLTDHDDVIGACAA